MTFQTTLLATDKTATAGDYTIIFPTADSSNAILRIG